MLILLSWFNIFDWKILLVLLFDVVYERVVPLNLLKMIFSSTQEVKICFGNVNSTLLVCLIDRIQIFSKNFPNERFGWRLLLLFIRLNRFRYLFNVLIVCVKLIIRLKLLEVSLGWLESLLIHRNLNLNFVNKYQLYVIWYWKLVENFKSYNFYFYS